MAAIAAMAIVPATDRLSLVDKTAHCFIVPSTDLPPRSKYLFVQPFPPLPSANLTQRATLWRDPGVYARPIGQKQLFAGVERHRYIVSFYATSPYLAAKPILTVMTHKWLFFPIFSTHIQGERLLNTYDEPLKEPEGVLAVLKKGAAFFTLLLMIGSWITEGEFVQR